jgi:sigma-B regulation protein RsbU (phosphoserine phosphatase)
VSDAAGTPPPRVLIVDDTPLNRDLLTRRVTREGYATEVASNGREALDRLRAEPFDLVLLDVQMPVMDGPALLAVLREEGALSHVPVIVISAVDDPTLVVRCIELGAVDYLPKLYDPVLLRARMRAALDRKRLYDAEQRYARSMEQELEIGRQVQRHFLPAALPAPAGVDLDAVLRPARQVSGDFYDAFPVSNDLGIFFVVGDVCDKGVGAALFMALFRSLIRASADPVSGGAARITGARRSAVAQALLNATPAELLSRVAGFTNDYIARVHDRASMFATAFFGHLDVVGGRVDYLNAGHEPALVLDPAGGVRELDPTGPALGLMPDTEFGTDALQLEAGQLLLVHTDGVAEARDPSGAAFGAERLRLAVAGGAPSAAELHRRLLVALDAFTGATPRADDVTLLTLRWVG